MYGFGCGAVIRIKSAAISKSFFLTGSAIMVVLAAQNVASEVWMLFSKYLTLDVSFGGEYIICCEARSKSL